VGDLYRAYKNDVEFILVYVKEAHPADGRQMEVNKLSGVVYNTPTTLQERARVASDCVKSLKFDFPCLLDDMQDTVQKQYQAWPAKTCLVDKEGKIRYVTKGSPRGVNATELESALKQLLNASGREQTSSR
jgi:peroxiredoxin